MTIIPLDTDKLDSWLCFIYIIEAYPSLRAGTDLGNYRGPMALYLKHGFTREKHGRQTVARLYLQNKDNPADIPI